jgi:hypothetical protein
MRFTLSRLAPIAALACALAMAPAALATATNKQIKTATSAGAGYLGSQQQPDGSFAGFGGEWALSALAAARVAPADLKTGPGSTDARTYYRNLIGDTATWPGGEPSVTDFEDAALAAYGAGIDPARVSSTQNLIAQIASYYQPAHAGFYGEAGFFNGTAFALLALADAKTRSGKQRVPQVLLDESIEIVRHNQHTDGGWTFAEAEGSKAELESPSEAELTGASMAALCDAGVPSSDTAIVKAVKFLESELAAEPAHSGAFETEFGPNTDTNAWVVQGLNACGISAQGPEFTTSTGKTPLDYLISQQLAGGGFAYQTETSPNLYSSQDAVRALAGAGFTVAPPAAKSAPRWVYEKDFATSGSVAGLLTLVIDNGTPALGVCAVSIAPQALKTTLAKVLEAAETAARPSGCVTGFTPASGNGPITSIDGAPSPAHAGWSVSIDGGREKQAKRNSPIHIGDTIYLRLS